MRTATWWRVVVGAGALVAVAWPAQAAIRPAPAPPRLHLSVNIPWLALPRPYSADARPQAAPPLPPGLTPVFDLVGPVASPVCSAASLVVVALPVLEPSLAGTVDPLLPLVGPIVLVCGEIPSTKDPSTCILDAQAQSTLNGLLSKAGVPLPVNFEPLGDAVDEVSVVESDLPPPANAAGLAKLASGVLSCTKATSVTTPTSTTVAAPNVTTGTTGTTVTTTPVPAGSGDEVSAAPGLPEAVLTAPDDDQTLPAGPVALGTPATSPSGLASPGGGTSALGSPATGAPAAPQLAGMTRGAGIGYSYAAIWLLPIGLLVALAILGHELTKDLSSSSR